MVRGPQDRLIGNKIDMTAQDFWKTLDEEEKLEFMRLRNQYRDYLDLSRNQFIEQFLTIWRETRRGQISRNQQASQ